MPHKRNDVNHPAISISTVTGSANTLVYPSLQSDSQNIIKRYPGRGYAVIPNSTLEDLRIKDSLGLLVYLVGKPDDWTVRHADLTRRFEWKKHKIYRLLKELELAGYLRRTFMRDEGGHVIGIVSQIANESIFDYEPLPNKFNNEKTQSTDEFSPLAENQEAGLPHADFLHAGKLDAGNQHAYKIKSTSTKEIFSTNKTDPTREITSKSKLEGCLEKEKAEAAEEGAAKVGASTTTETSSPPNLTRTQLRQDNPNPPSSCRSSADRATTTPVEAKNGMEMAVRIPPTSTTPNSPSTTKMSPEEKPVAFRDIPADIVFNAPIRTQLSAAGIKLSYINYWIKEFGEELLNSFWSEMKERVREIQITSTGGYLCTLVMAERNIRNGKTAENVVCADAAMFVGGQSVDS